MVLSGISSFYAIILYPQPFLLLLGAAGPHQPNLLGAASPRRILGSVSPGNEGGWQEGTVPMEGKGVPGHFICLFVYICISQGITVLLFNDV